MSTRISPAAAQALTSLRWTEDEARRVLDAVTASGLTIADFARAHRVTAQRLYVWQRRLARTPPAPDAAPSPHFVEVSLRTPARVELLWPAGPTVRFEGPLDAETLRTVLRVLREAGAC